MDDGWMAGWMHGCMMIDGRINDESIYVRMDGCRD